MGDNCSVFLLGLISLCSFLTGTCGVDESHVFCISGENVRLPCNNALSDCTSTTWNYGRLTHSQTVELVGKGKIKNDIERHERLSLGSDCSLNIKKVTKEDYGSYTCQQHDGQQRIHARVYLHFLHVSSSSSQTEIRSGSSVTLSCQLYSYGVLCDTLIRTEGIQLMWVNQAGVNLMTDSRYQILFSSTHCISTLTTTLLNEDHNREWRCQLTQRNQLKTSATFNFKDSDQADTVTPVILVHTTNLEEPSATNIPTVSPLVMVVIFPASAVLLPAAMLWVIYTKKDDNKVEAVDSDVLTYVSYSGMPHPFISVH